MGIGSTRTSGLSTAHLQSVNLQGTPIALLMVFVLSALRFQSSDFTSSNTAPMKHSALLFLSSNQIPNLYLGFILFVGFFFLPCSLSHNGLPSRPSDTWIGCCLRVPPTAVGLANLSDLSGALLTMCHLIVLIMSRSKITVFDMSHFTASSVVTSATRLLTAKIAGSMSLFNVISR